MSAFLVGHITVKNEKLWQDYVLGVKESLLPFEAKVIFRGRVNTVLAGEYDHDLVVVIEFADQSCLGKWYHSASYQSLISLRDTAADVVLLACDM